MVCLYGADATEETERSEVFEAPFRGGVQSEERMPSLLEQELFDMLIWSGCDRGNRAKRGLRGLRSL